MDKSAVASAPASSAAVRLPFIDNLRWVMIVCVISIHAAVTYSHLGSWYFMEDPRPGRVGMILFAYYQMGLQAFFMGLLFFIAGYFVPGAFARKGATKFLKDRFVRLLLPAAFYMAVIHPVIVFGLLREDLKVTASFGKAYLHYLASLRFLGSSGPMWFTIALFIFCLAYVAVPRANPAHDAGPVDSPSNDGVVRLALTMGLCTFLMRIVQPMGTSILNMQLCFFAQYIVLFIVGVYAWRGNWLARIPYEFGRRWFWWGLIAGSLVWLAAILTIVATHTEQKIGGGFTWQSAVICFWEAFFCLSMCLGLIVYFREYFNQQGRFAKWMTDNSFAVYMFHAPVLIVITLLLHTLSVPKGVKFFTATLLATVATYLASAWIFRRTPLLRRIL